MAKHKITASMMTLAGMSAWKRMFAYIAIDSL